MFLKDLCMCNKRSNSKRLIMSEGQAARQIRDTSPDDADNGALLSSNGAQLKLLLGKYGHDWLWLASLIIVSFSILSQLVLFILLAILAESHVADRTKRRTMNIINDCVLGLTSIIFATNIIANILV